MHKKSILIISSGEAFAFLDDLLKAYAKKGIGVFHGETENTVPDMDELSELAKDRDAILLIAPGNRAPGTVIKSPYVTADGKNIPVGILLPRQLEDLAVFAATAAQVHARTNEIPAIALLSQRHQRYRQLSARVEEILNTNEQKIKSFKWTSDIVFPEDMFRGVNSGLGISMYLGHGRPKGWVGYYGTRIHHFEEHKNEPLGCMLSICCHTASRRKTSVSFTENLVYKGIASSSFGAVTATKHTDNTRWAVNFVEGLIQGHSTIGELMIAALPQHKSAIHAYRLIGDPLAPVFSPQAGIERAATIKTYE